MKKRYLAFLMAAAMFCMTAFPAMAAEYDPDSETKAMSEMSEEAQEEDPSEDSEDQTQEEEGVTDETLGGGDRSGRRAAGVA